MPVQDFDPGSDEPGYLFVKLADHITTRIEEHELAPGSRLPGERDFSMQYGVSIGTVRRATEVLRERGLVITLPAKGSFVAPVEQLQRLSAAEPSEPADDDSWYEAIYDE